MKPKTTEKVTKAAQWKKDKIKKLVELIKEYPIVGVVNMANIPCAQLQQMSKKLRGKAMIFMTRKRLLNLALQEAEKSKAGVLKLKENFGDIPALILTKDNPFMLYKLLEKNRSNAPAKIGQICPKDIIVPAGPTSFTPGPIISELSAVGIKTGIENGKIVVKADTVVAKAGKVIDAKLVNVFTKFAIEPMEIGLDLICAYEKGVIFAKNVLGIDDKKLFADIIEAARISYNLTLDIGYATKDNAAGIVGRAFRQAKGLAGEAKLELQ